MELEKLDAWRPLLAEELKKPYFAALAERDESVNAKCFRDLIL